LFIDFFRELGLSEIELEGLKNTGLLGILTSPIGIGIAVGVSLVTLGLFMFKRRKIEKI